MDELVFRNFNEVTASAIPTALGFDPTTQRYVIGDAARKLASQGFPVIQNFKRTLGDVAPLFEGTNPDSLLSIHAGIGVREGRSLQKRR